MKVNSNTIELTVHTYCYCFLDLLCVSCGYPFRTHILDSNLDFFVWWDTLNQHFSTAGTSPVNGTKKNWNGTGICTARIFQGHEWPLNCLFHDRRDVILTSRTVVIRFLSNDGGYLKYQNVDILIFNPGYIVRLKKFVIFREIFKINDQILQQSWETLL